MSQQGTYYKIGLFVIAGLAFLLFLLIFFGSGSFFKKYITAETYFDESVQGLDVGSPVKYRGVTIGKVDDIDMVGHLYGKKGSELISKYDRYIYVKFSISPKLLNDQSRGKIDKIIQRSIYDGLRARLATQDLVGTVYLELNFVNPKSNPILQIDWHPKHTYIPSAKSTLTRFTDNVEKLITQLDKINFSAFIDKLDTLVTTTTDTLNATQMQKLSDQTLKTLNIINQTANATNVTLSDISKAVNTLDHSLDHITVLIGSQNQTIANTFSELSSLTQNMNDLAGNLKQYPSQVIFGGKPPALDPSRL